MHSLIYIEHTIQGVPKKLAHFGRHFNPFLHTFPGGIFWAGKDFIAPFLSKIQEPLTSCHLNKHARSYGPSKLPYIVPCALSKVHKEVNKTLYMVTLRVYNSKHVCSNDKRSTVPESLIKMVRENAFLPKKFRQEMCAGKG